MYLNEFYLFIKYILTSFLYCFINIFYKTHSHTPKIDADKQSRLKEIRRGRRKVENKKEDGE